MSVAHPSTGIASRGTGRPPRITRVALLALPLLLLLLLCACPPPPPPVTGGCTGDADCTSDFLCVNGACVDPSNDGDGGVLLDDSGSPPPADAGRGDDGGLPPPDDGGVPLPDDAGYDAGVDIVDAGPGCGDGVVEGIEHCDDGNNTDGDGCSASCQVFPPLGCDAVELPSGAEVDCAALLGSGADAWCSAVYSSPSTVPNTDLIAACGECHPWFFRAPIGAVCGVGFEPIPAPEPGLFDPGSSSCVTCHAPNGYDGSNSLEHPHPASPVTCIECHGGDGTEAQAQYAHVCPPAEVGDRVQQFFDTRAFFLSYSLVGVELLADYSCNTSDGGSRMVSPREWLAFRNPGDLRSSAFGRGCGGCHNEEVGDVIRSLRSTNAGVFGGARHGAGIPNAFGGRADDANTLVDVAAVAVTNPDYSAGARVVSEVPSVSKAPVVAGEGFQINNIYTATAVNNSLELTSTGADNYPNGNNNQVAASLFQEVLNQSCAACHLNGAPRSNGAWRYRSTGCTACHYRVAPTGRSSTRDLSVNGTEPADDDYLTPTERPHLHNHRMVSRLKVPGRDTGINVATLPIEDRACSACHTGSSNIWGQYRGVRVDQNQNLAANNWYPSSNTVENTWDAELFGPNATAFGLTIQQWVATEIWQDDFPTQDETPPDVHHEAGLGCVDCHGLGTQHGTGRILGRMKASTDSADARCETCHGDIDDYADMLDGTGTQLTHAVMDDAAQGNIWLVSKVTGQPHYVPQVRDVVNATGSKQYPPGTARAGQPIFDAVGSYAMGRYQADQDLSDGYGPAQPSKPTAHPDDGFSHTTGRLNAALGGLECYACHAAWQNNCVGCHLEGYADGNPSNFFYSAITGERLRFNANANALYQNPVEWLLGINERGRIAPMMSMARFFRYTDLNATSSARIAWSDRNGLGNDPQLRNFNRSSQPSLGVQPITPHTIRSRWSVTTVGGRGCLDCHMGDTNGLTLHDQADGSYDLTAYYADNYAAAAQTAVKMSRGQASHWRFDVDGYAVADTNEPPVFDLSSIVGDDVVGSKGVVNGSTGHPRLDPTGASVHPDYDQTGDQNGAALARPLTNVLLNRLDNLDDLVGGLGDVYYFNDTPGSDPMDNGRARFFLNDRGF
jgi:cysteine-rich repeat protein